MAQKIIYLDYAAATPLDPLVLKAMQPYFADKFYNPSAAYLGAKGVAQDVGAARSKVAHWLGARPSEVVFTAGGTEANNLAIHGIMKNFPEGNIVTSAIEHESVLEPARQYDHSLVNVQPDGRIDMDGLASAIDDKTVLVCVIYANNEIGTIQPLKRISEQIQTVKKNRQKRGVKLPIYFHADACQAGAYLDLHASRLGVDLMTINGGKIYGPKQSGALFVKTGTIIKPIITGGGQESGRRSGTENVAGAIGFAEAFDIVQKRRHKESKSLEKLRSIFISELQKKLPGIIINGSMKYRLPNNVHATLPGQDNERLMMLLDEAGIQCAVGSACSASSDKPSHVLAAIGLTEKAARSSLRFSLGHQTIPTDITQTIKTLANIIP